MTLETYRLIHLLGGFSLLTSFGVILFSEPGRTRMGVIFHGVSMFLIVFAGEGKMRAKYGLSGGTPWIVAKYMIWLLLGLWVSVAKRRPHAGKKFFWLPLLLAGVAAFLGVMKPF
jgi:hypothetical protein